MGIALPCRSAANKIMKAALAGFHAVTSITFPWVDNHQGELLDGNIQQGK
jgi:hypothetical protein